MRSDINIYHYDERGFLTKVKKARLSPKELKNGIKVPLVPRNATLIEPPKINSEEKVQFKNNAWHIISKEEIEKEKKKIEEELKEIEKVKKKIEEELEKEKQKSKEYIQTFMESIVYLIKKELGDDTISKKDFEKNAKIFLQLVNDFLP